MQRREFIKLTTLGAASLALPRRAGAARSARRPNIVHILIDDMGWRDVGFMGNTFYETPNIDRLAAEGVVFTNAYTNGPNCAPTRACILSGQYTPRHGIYTVRSPARGSAKHRKLIPTPNKTKLSPAIVTIAEALKPFGYVSASMGKWHMGDDPTHGPIAQGFDVNIGGGRWGLPPAGYFAPYKLPNIEDAPKGEYLTDRLTEEACQFIATNKDKPFFLYLPHYAVHTPIQAKKEITAKYRKKPGAFRKKTPVYAAMIESTDQGVGRILAELDRHGLTEDTVVVFGSDNGGLQMVTSMAPLRGQKGMLNEGGIRVPTAVRWPGKIQPGTKCDVPVITTDLYPTFLEMAGAKRPEGQVLDGESIVPLLRGKDALGDRALYWHFPAYLQGKARGARDEHFRTRPAGAVRKGDWKLIEYFEDGYIELYNLADDIGEQTNLAASRPEKREELLGLLRKWRADINAPVPTEPNPKYDPTAPAEPTKQRARKRRKRE